MPQKKGNVKAKGFFATTKVYKNGDVKGERSEHPANTAIDTKFCSAASGQLILSGKAGIFVRTKRKAPEKRAQKKQTLTENRTKEGETKEDKTKRSLKLCLNKQKFKPSVN